MDQNIKSTLLSLTQSQAILSEEVIQALWSGYGELTRVKLDNKSIITKLIKFPKTFNHPKGWSSEFSHRRKVKSYKVEINWYKNYKKHLPESYTPQYIASGEAGNTQYLILEDLAVKKYISKKEITKNEVKLCLKWLAIFHAKYLDTHPKNLWNIGTYWHLETRPEEFEKIDDEELKNSACLIDEKLNGAKYKTIVHGDAKLANFLFNENAVSAVDFQYVGAGVGVKDLAYFLSSIYDENELFKNEKVCLDYYFQELLASINLYSPQINASLIEKEWRDLYPYAWSDFYRFLKGWSPRHNKLNDYTEHMKDKVLNELKEK